MSNLKHFVLRKALPFGSAAIVLVGCASQTEVNDLREQVGILQREVDNKDILLEAYGIEFDIKEEENTRLREENERLYRSLIDAQNSNSRLEEQIENMMGPSNESEVVEKNDSSTKNDVKIDASSLYIFDTTKIPSENGSFEVSSYDYDYNYRSYWLVQACQFKEYPDSGVWNYFGEVISRYSNQNGDQCRQSFMGFISGDTAYAEHIDGYFMDMDGSFSSCYSLAADNPVPIETYVSLNEFLISKGLSDMVK